MPIDLDALSALIADRALVIVIALILDAILGGVLARLSWLRSERWAGRITGLLDRRLNRERRSDQARTIRGVAAIVMIAGLAAAAGVAAERLLEWAGFLSVTAMIVLVAAGFGQRRLIGPLAKAALFIATGQIAEARRALAPIMGRDTGHLDQHGLARAGVEAAAERLAFGMVAPAAWFMLFGLPGLFVQRAVDAADHLIGYRTARHQAFGLATARLNDALTLIPSLIAALLAALAAAFVPRGMPLAAAAALYRGPWRSPLRAALWPEAAFAGALGLALGGPRQYGTDRHFAPWVNPGGRARAEAADLRRALYLFIVSNLLLAGLALLIGLAAES